MIRSFRHKGLKDLYEGRSSRRVAPAHVRKLENMLATLDASNGPEGMRVPGPRLHALSGNLRGYYVVSVSGNWRDTFRFEGGDAVDVDYVDYH
jgi:proteic killer suppression protein